MKKTDTSFAKLLVAYYGLIEVAHIIVLLLAGIRLARTGAIGFPAPPPPGGWAPQVRPFLMATAAVDAVNVLIAFLFVYGYFTTAHWRWWVGGVTLTASLYSAILFAVGTIASGAWAHRPIGYGVMVILFIPVEALVITYLIWGVTGRFRDGAPHGKS